MEPFFCRFGVIDRFMWLTTSISSLRGLYLWLPKIVPGMAQMPESTSLGTDSADKYRGSFHIHQLSAAAGAGLLLIATERVRVS
jgi:hypothetical protein